MRKLKEIDLFKLEFGALILQNHNCWNVEVKWVDQWGCFFDYASNYIFYFIIAAEQKLIY